MIIVDNIDAGIFQVVITDAELDTLIACCVRVDLSPDDILQGLLRFSIGVYSKSLIRERSQDGLDGKNERVGRG